MFVVLEGTDGVGKSTQALLLKTYFEGLGYSVLMLRQPGQTQLGEDIRKIILKNDKLKTETDLFLFLASHIQGFYELKEQIKNYDLIILDRSVLSTACYQGCLLKDRMPPVKILKFYQKLINYFKFDLLIYFDLDPSVSLSRARDVNKFELKGKDYLKKVYAEYQDIIENEFYHLITKDFEHIPLEGRDVNTIFNLLASKIEEKLKNEESN